MSPKLIASIALLAALAVGCRSEGTPMPPTVVPPSATPNPTFTSPPSPVPATPTRTVSPTPAGPVEMRYLAYHGGGAHGGWEITNTQDFMAANPEIMVVLDRLDIYNSPVPVSVQSRMSASPPPDVISGFMAGVFLDYVESGLIADITDLWVENGWYDVFPQSAIDMASVNGRQYFVPMAVQWHPIWYRTDIFAGFGLEPPESWEALMSICETLRTAETIPFTMSVAGWNPPVARWFTYINLRINGPEFHARLLRGQEHWDDPRVFAVFERWQEAVDRGCFGENFLTTTYARAASQLGSGEAAMYLLGEWLSESYPLGLDPMIDFFRFPVIDPAVPNGEIGHFYGAFLHAEAAHPAQARAFLSHLGSAEAQSSFARVLGRVSTHSQVDPAIFDPLYLRGIELIRDSGSLTALFELGTHQDLALAGLNTFVEFLRNPEGLADSLAALEGIREEVYGPLP